MMRYAKVSSRINQCNIFNNFKFIGNNRIIEFNVNNLWSKRKNVEQNN